MSVPDGPYDESESSDVNHYISDEYQAQVEDLLSSERDENPGFSVIDIDDLRK